MCFQWGEAPRATGRHLSAPDLSGGQLREIDLSLSRVEAFAVQPFAVAPPPSSYSGLSRALWLRYGPNRFRQEPAQFARTALLSGGAGIDALDTVAGFFSVKI